MRSCLLLTAIFIIGCAYTPAEQEEILSQLQVGVTTQADIERKPSGVMHEDGDEVWLISFESEEPGRGGAETRTRIVRLRWDENGVLKSFSNDPAR